MTDVDDIIKNAEIYLQKRDFNAASEVLIKGAALYADHIYINFLNGFVEVHKGNISSAAHFFGLAAQLSNGSSQLVDFHMAALAGMGLSEAAQARLTAEGLTQERLDQVITLYEMLVESGNAEAMERLNAFILANTPISGALHAQVKEREEVRHRNEAGKRLTEKNQPEKIQRRQKVFVVDNTSRTYRQRPSETIWFHHFANTGGNTLFCAVLDNIPDLPWFQTTVVNPETTPKPPAGRSFVFGHNLFGLKEARGWQHDYFTILRDPLERFVSEYFWINRANQAKDQIFSSMCQTILDYDDLNLYIYETSVVNYATTKIHYTPGLSFGISAEEAYLAACKNLDEKFFLVGITELFDETLFVLLDILGVRDVSVWDRNAQAPSRSPQRPSISELPVAVRRKLERATAWDQKLYDLYRERFEALLGQADFGDQLIKYKWAGRGVP